MSHGLPGALNACWKFSATGVSPWAATSLIVTRRGSSAAYSLSAKSLRETALPSLASTSTCASSDIIQFRKFQACAAFFESFEMPMPSPPTKVETPPSTPGMPATPASNSRDGRSVAGNGITPTLPSLKAAVQVGPASSVELGSTAPAFCRSAHVS